METITEVGVGVFVHRLAHEESNFVSVLAGCRHSNGAIPIKIEMAQFKGEDLKTVGAKLHFIINDVIVGGRDSAVVIANVLVDEIKVVRVGRDTSSINHRARRGVVRAK